MQQLHLPPAEYFVVLLYIIRDAQQKLTMEAEQLGK